MSWIAVLLAKHPHIRRKLQEELHAVLPRKEDLKLVDLKKLLYLTAIIKEAMRLHPVVGMLGRQVAHESDTITKDGQNIELTTVSNNLFE